MPCILLSCRSELLCRIGVVLQTPALREHVLGHADCIRAPHTGQRELDRPQAKSGTYLSVPKVVNHEVRCGIWAAHRYPTLQQYVEVCPTGGQHDPHHRFTLLRLLREIMVFTGDHSK